MRIKTTLDKLNKGLVAIRSKGGRVSIYDDGGDVSISGVSASFDFDHDTDILTVTIIDKPWLATDSMIEEKIREFFG